MTGSHDPLAGRRQAINDGDVDTLLWPDEGKGCPVDVGQVFELRSCAIEITGTRRVRRGRSEWLWRATFQRIYRAGRVYLLAARGAGDEGHGYVGDDKAALASGAERPEWKPREGETVPQGPPPEPEAIPPHEVKDLPTSVAARRRYQEQHQENAERLRAQPLPIRLAALRRLASERHVDISSDERVIERRIAAIEAKVLKDAA